MRARTNANSQDPTHNATVQLSNPARVPGLTNIYVVPFNGGLGGLATPVNGAATPEFEEYYPELSPDDRLMAFTRVPAVNTTPVWGLRRPPAPAVSSTAMSTMARFVRYELRTTDVAAARAFYETVLGEGAGGADIVPLPEAAAARGAPPHWMGHLGVGDDERAAAAFVALGATRLGPTRPTDGGGQVAIVRDPGGAVVALATTTASPARAGVVWHQLNTTDLARTTAGYCGLFGWQLTERLDLGAHGVHQQFAWDASGASVGWFTDIAGRPGRHPHWLFHFRVAALEPAVAAVRAARGLVLGPFVLPGGERLAVCDDPQGAAFALRERAI